ncbi:MAG: phage tail tape measure protein, partial [Dehalococcoidia bacterium]
MAENLGDAVLKLSTDNTGLNKGLRAGEKQTKSTMGRMQAAAVKNRKAIGIGMLATGAAIAGVGLIAVNAARAFETSFAGVRKTVSATEEQFAELAGGFRQLSKEIPVNVNELNRIGEAAGQLGIKRENIIDFTETIAKLGVTTNLTGEEAATALARIANVTGLSQKEFGNMGSAIVELGNNLATTEAEILTFAQRIAGAGTIAGLTETDLLAIGGAMTSVGVQAEAGGTAVQKVLLGINQAVIEGGAKLDVFAKTSGLSAEEFGKVWEEDAGEAFNLFVEGLANEGDNAINVLEQLDLTDQRLIRAFLSLSNAGDLLRDSIELSSKAFAENTALTKEAEERFKTFDSRLQLAKNQMNDLSISIGMVLLPVVSALIAKVLPLIDTIGAWIEEHQTLTKIIAIAVLGLGALLVVFGALFLILPGLVIAISLVGPAMTLAMGPVGIAIVVIAGLVAIGIKLWRNWSVIWPKIKAVTQTVGNFLIGMFNKITFVQRKFITTFLSGLEAVLNVASKIPGVGNKFKAMADAIQTAKNAVDEGIPSLDLASDAVGKLATKTGEAIEATAEFGESFALTNAGIVENQIDTNRVLADLETTRNEERLKGNEEWIASVQRFHKKQIEEAAAAANAVIAETRKISDSFNQLTQDMQFEFSVQGQA